MEKKEIKEKKLTDEIIKALEFKANVNAKVAYLDGCACRHIWVADILDLINRLQEENADYKRKLEDGELVSKEWHDEQVMMLLRERDNLADYVKILKKEVDELKAENESFGKTINEASTTLRKQRAEIERLTEEKKEAYQQGFVDGNAYETKMDELALKYEQAVKDTAKEICDLILEHWEKKQFVECDWLRVAIAEKYGVEVE